MKTKIKTVVVDSTAWVAHKDHPQGYEVTLHASEDGAYEAVLEAIKTIAEEDDNFRARHEVESDEYGLLAATEAKDGRKALEAFNKIINSEGGEAVGNVYLWVTEQKVEK